MPLFDSILDFFSKHLLDLAGGIWAAVAFVIAFLAKRYLVPLVQVEKHRRYACWIAAIADELTDDLKARYPDRRWVEKLDEAVDRMIEICGIEKEIAKRALSAAAARKS